MDLGFIVGQMDKWKAHSKHCASFFLCILQFCLGLVRLVQLRTKAHPLRRSNIKGESIHPPLNKRFLLVCQSAGKNALQGFVLFFY
jgi:hypothetical protein